jgi:hypothetical protein
MEVPGEPVPLLLAEAPPTRGAGGRIPGGQGQAAGEREPHERSRGLTHGLPDEVRERALELRGQGRHRAHLRHTASSEGLTRALERQGIALEAAGSDLGQVGGQGQGGQRVQLVRGEAEAFQLAAPRALDVAVVDGQRLQGPRKRASNLGQESAPPPDSRSAGARRWLPAHVRTRRARKRLASLRRDSATSKASPVFPAQSGPPIVRAGTEPLHELGDSRREGDERQVETPTRCDRSL